MKTLRFLWRRLLHFGPDTSAQALTEAVIIIPAIVFFFAASLQTALITQTAQLANYAAFAAARSFATSHGRFQDVGRAKSRAHLAACLVMAPVSQATPSESNGAFNNLRMTAGFLAASDTAYPVIEGFAMAYLTRIQNFTLSEPDLGYDRDDSILSISFDYMCPLKVPGLANMWDYLFYREPGTGLPPSQTFANAFVGVTATGYRGDLADFQLAIQDFTNLDPWSAPFFQSAINDIVGFVNSSVGSPATHPGNIPVKAKCAMGFEPWTGGVRTPGATTQGAAGDPSLAACEQERIRLQDLIIEAGNIQSNECEQAYNASNDWFAAEQALALCQGAAVSNALDPTIVCAAEIADEAAKDFAYNVIELPQCEAAEDETERRIDDQTNLQCP